jgi:hypothetical protein
VSFTKLRSLFEISHDLLVWNELGDALRGTVHLPVSIGEHRAERVGVALDVARPPSTLALERLRKTGAPRLGNHLRHRIGEHVFAACLATSRCLTL